MTKTEATAEGIRGFVNARGYLSCLACALLLALETENPVYSDSAPHNAEPCDFCHEPIDRK